MQLRQLRYFVAVAEQLNFRKAAENLYVTQPLLSKQIAELEHEIGQELFIRNTRSVKLTPAGQVLLSEADALIRQAAMVIKTVRKAGKDGQVSGVLRIGYEDAFDRVMMVQALGAFKEKYPNVELNIQHYSFYQITRALRESCIDCAFILLPDKKLAPQLSCRVLRNDALCFVASKRRIQNDGLEEYIQLAQEEAMYLLEKNSKMVSLICEVCAEMDIAPEFHFVDSIRTMLLYAEAGVGVAVVPWSVYEAYQSPYLAAHRIASERAFQCMACAWNSRDGDRLTNLLLEEFQQVDLRCESCPNDWCKMHSGPKEIQASQED